MAIEILKQPQYQPFSLGDEVVILFAVNAGLLADIPLDRLVEFEGQFLRHVNSAHPDIIQAITDSKDITPEIEERLTQVTNDFKAGFAS